MISVNIVCLVGVVGVDISGNNSILHTGDIILQ